MLAEPTAWEPPPLTHPRMHTFQKAQLLPPPFRVRMCASPGPILQPACSTLKRHLRRLYANRHALRFRFMSMERIFTDIYQRHVWHDPASRSGSGSTERNTVAVRAALPVWLSDLAVKTLLDLPCGDFNWLQHVELGVDHDIGVASFKN